MKKILLSILILMAAVGVPAAASAADTDPTDKTHRYVGHSTTSDVYGEGLAFPQVGTFDIGAILDPSVLSLYSGCRILGIRLSSATDLGRTDIFIYNIAADGTMTQLHSQKQRIYEGWNDVYFNGDGIAISGKETLFYGFKCPYTQEMADAKIGPINCYETVSAGGFKMMQDGKLLDVTGVGDLCVQLIVDISSLPADRIVFAFFDTGFKYKQPQDGLELYTIVSNIGRTPVTSFEVEYSFDDGAATLVNADNVDLATNGQIEWTHNITFPESFPIGSHKFSAKIVGINGTKLATDQQLGQSVNFALYKNSITRNYSYTEVYTSQADPYSALLNAHFFQMDPTVAGRNIIVKTFPPDEPLGIEDAGYLHDLYAYTYPTFTINRSYYPGENHIAYDLNDYLLSIPFLIPPMLDELIDQDFATPSFSGLELSGYYDDATRELTVHASGNTLDEATAIVGDLGLTVMLCEDNVNALQYIVDENYQVTLNKHYTHDNVLRQYLSNPRGDKLSPANNKFETKYTVNIPKDWNPNNLRVVALLSKYGEADADNAKDFDIMNANCLDISSLTGVGSIEGDELMTSDCCSVYTLQGICICTNADAETLRSLPKGIYIINGKKVAL